MKNWISIFFCGILILAAAGLFPAGASAERAVTVRPGDTLYGLARNHLGDQGRWKEIAILNGLRPPYPLAVGDTILLPVPDSTRSASPEEQDTVPTREEFILPDDEAALEPDPASQPAQPATVPQFDQVVELDEIDFDGKPRNDLEDLAKLIAIAHERNREILAARAFAEAAHARIKPAGSLDDPTLGVGYQEGMGFKNVPSLGDDIMSQVFISLEQMFPGPGKRALRKEIAEHMWKHKEAEVDAVTLKVEARLKRLYWELYRIDAERDILERTRENLRALTAAAETRYAAGLANQEDVIRSGLEISMITERLRMLTSERRSAVAELNAVLDREPQVAIGRAQEAPTFEIPSVEKLRELAHSSCPLIVALQHVVMHEEAAVRLAEAERRPDWGIMGSVMPRGSLPTMWSIGFKITLPIRQGERQDEWVREAEANLEGARQTLEGHWAEIRAQLETLTSSSLSARDLVTLYNEAILPQAELALRSSLASYQTGRADFMTVIANVVSLRQYEVEKVRRLSEFHQAVAQIEALVAQRIESNVIHNNTQGVHE